MSVPVERGPHPCRSIELAAIVLESTIECLPEKRWQLASALFGDAGHAVQRLLAQPGIQSIPLLTAFAEKNLQVIAIIL